MCCVVVALGCALTEPAAAEMLRLAQTVPGMLTPSDAIAVVRSSGMRPTGIPEWRGRNYVVRAVDKSGDPVRVVIDARMGEIRSVVPVLPAREYPPVMTDEWVPMPRHLAPPPPGAHDDAPPPILYERGPLRPIVSVPPSGPAPPMLHDRDPPDEPPSIVAPERVREPGLLPPPPERFPPRTPAAPAAKPAPVKTAPVKRAAAPVAPANPPLPKPKPGASPPPAAAAPAMPARAAPPPPTGGAKPDAEVPY
jgi:hypothetical protein